MIKTRRQEEAKIIRKANRASAIGQLMLGQFNRWEDFLDCDSIDYTNLPRRQLKSGKHDVKNRLSAEIEKFCRTNFASISPKTLSTLYEDTKSNRGLELPLGDFEEKYGRFNSHVLKGNPRHLTVCISLWGLQIKFPEDFLSKDVITGMELLSRAMKDLSEFELEKHDEIVKHREEIGTLIRKKEFASRSIVLTCFNLLESYLNGIAWDYSSSPEMALLSNNKKKMIADAGNTSIREKLLKYPAIIAGEDFPANMAINGILELIKPFRDSVVHASPFAAPEKYGGYDKLRMIYDLNERTSVLTVWYLIESLKCIREHMKHMERLNWLASLEESFNSLFGEQIRGIVNL